MGILIGGIAILFGYAIFFGFGYIYGKGKIEITRITKEENELQQQKILELQEAIDKYNEMFEMVGGE